MFNLRNIPLGILFLHILSYPLYSLRKINYLIGNIWKVEGTKKEEVSEKLPLRRYIKTANTGMCSLT